MDTGRGECELALVSGDTGIDWASLAKELHPSDHMDLAAVIRISQTLSGEIVHVRLVEKLMTLALEHAGAQRGALVLQKAGGLWLEATASSEAGDVSVTRTDRPVTPEDLPDAILQHVMHTRRSVLLDDARQAHAFSGRESLRRPSLQAILCLPLIREDRFMGLLYLENHLATQAFTQERQAVLDLLSSQAAISLKNADLYARLEQENAERRQSEAALRRSEERYALAIDAAADGHADWLADEDVFYCSPRLLQLLGLPAELSITRRQHLLDRFPFHPEDRDRCLAILDHLRDSDAQRLEFDARVIVRGEVRWMHVTTLYLRDSSGRLLRTSTATTDITARRRAEEELRVSEERYALALAGSDESIFDWDLKSDRLYIGARTQELLGIPVGEVWRARDDWQRLVQYHPEDAGRHRAAMDAHVAGETSMYDIEARILLPDGVRWVHQRGRALRDDEGRAYRVVGSISDVTDRKREQEEMLRLEIRLRQAERFEAMGTMAGGIAHDFNNILGAILGFGERALRTVEEGSRLHHDLGNVIVAGERGRTLVDRILSFSRGSTGERVPVHVERVVREALNFLQAKLPPRIALETRLHAGSAAMYGETVQIHQLLMNLGTNAVHAMLGEGTLSVALDAVDIVEAHQATIGSVTPGAWLVLKVADEGTGIPDEIVSRIFDPFFSTKEAGVGSGLGLSLVRRIVMQVGGAIDVETESCVGTTFTIYLPRAGDAPEESDDTTQSPPAGQGQRLLVVDDEEPLLELTTDALRELGYEAVGFGSAVAALRAFRADPDAFDAVITDQRMPVMSGDMLIREMRRIRPLIPVILVSGYVGDTAVSPADCGWADEILTKPLRANALATSLARVLLSPRTS